MAVATEQTVEEAVRECREVQAALAVRAEAPVAGPYADLLRQP